MKLYSIAFMPWIRESHLQIFVQASELGEREKKGFKTGSSSVESVTLGSRNIISFIVSEDLIVVLNVEFTAWQRRRLYMSTKIRIFS